MWLVFNLLITVEQCQVGELLFDKTVLIFDNRLHKNTVLGDTSNNKFTNGSQER